MSTELPRYVQRHDVNRLFAELGIDLDQVTRISFAPWSFVVHRQYRDGNGEIVFASPWEGGDPLEQAFRIEIWDERP